MSVPSWARMLDAEAEAFSNAISGLSPSHLVGKDLDILTPLFDGVLPDFGRSSSVDLVLGSLRLELEISPLDNDGSGAGGGVIEWRDLTRYRRSNAIVAAVEKHQVVIETNTEGRIVYLNSGANDILGIEEGQIPADDRGHTPTLKDAISGAAQGTPFNGVLSATCDEEDRWLRGLVIPVENSGGTFESAVAILMDITSDHLAAAVTETRTRESQQDQISVVNHLREGLCELSRG